MESKLEVYPDQFTPWIPNNIVEDGISYDADFLYGAAFTQFMQGDDKGGSLTYRLLTSALIVNFYLGILEHQSTK